MATLTAPLFRLLAQAYVGLTSPYDGSSTPVKVDFTVRPPNSTADGAWDLAARVELAPAASSTSTLDLRSVTDPEGTAITFAEVGLVVIECASTNGGLVHVSPNVSNGWTGLLADASDILKLGAGSKAAFYVPDNSAATGASNKDLDFANQDSGAAASITVTIFGRSA